MKWALRGVLAVTAAMILILAARGPLGRWLRSAPHSTADSTADEIAGFRLPVQSSPVVERRDGGNVFFRWMVDKVVIDQISTPERAEPLFEHSMNWEPFRMDYFGVLSASDLPSDAEGLFYRMPMWDVAIVRSRSEGALIVAGIYTK